jgi:hypothetical protein
MEAKMAKFVRIESQGGNYYIDPAAVQFVKVSTVDASVEIIVAGRQAHISATSRTAAELLTALGIEDSVNSGK